MMVNSIESSSSLFLYFEPQDCEIGRCRKVDCNVGSHCMIIFILWFVSVSTPLVSPTTNR